MVPLRGAALQNVGPEQWRDHPNPPLGKMGKGSEGKGQPKIRIQGGQDAVEADHGDLEFLLGRCSEIPVEKQELVANRDHGYGWSVDGFV